MTRATANVPLKSVTTVIPAAAKAVLLVSLTRTSLIGEVMS
jgi:hypothetical protein